MSIELLWIIPIVAVALLVLVVALSLQQKDEKAFNGIRDMKREVEDYNSGIASDSEENVARDTSEVRLKEIENTIQLVSTALSNQQKIIENFQGKDVALENEFNLLKQKLQEVQKEYDITISENYSLRARLNKAGKEVPEPLPEDNEISEDTDAIERSKVLNKKVFDDSHKIDRTKSSELDDTSEINLSDYKKK